MPKACIILAGPFVNKMPFLPERLPIICSTPQAGSIALIKTPCGSSFA